MKAASFRQTRQGKIHNLRYFDTLCALQPNIVVSALEIQTTRASSELILEQE